LCKNNSELTLKEISKKMDMNQSTISCILSTLIDYNYVNKTDDYTYKPSIHLFELGNKVRDRWDIHKISIPYMEEIVNDINETVNLVILDECKILFIDKKKASYEFEIGTQIGTRLPAHCSAAGKVLLASLSENRVNKIIEEEGLHKYTENTITDKNILKEELKKVLEIGYAIDNEELIENITCVAAPIKDHKDECIAALSVAGLSSRLRSKSIDKIAELIKSKVLKISRKIGY